MTELDLNPIFALQPGTRLSDRGCENPGVGEHITTSGVETCFRNPLQPAQIDDLVIERPASGLTAIPPVWLVGR